MPSLRLQSSFGTIGDADANEPGVFALTFIAGFNVDKFFVKIEEVIASSDWSVAVVR